MSIYKSVYVLLQADTHVHIHYIVLFGSINYSLAEHAKIYSSPLYLLLLQIELNSIFTLLMLFIFGPNFLT